MKTVTQYQILVAVWMIGMALFGITGIKHLILHQLILGLFAIIFCLICYGLILNKNIEIKLRREKNG